MARRSLSLRALLSDMQSLQAEIDEVGEDVVTLQESPGGADPTVYPELVLSTGVVASGVDFSIASLDSAGDPIHEVLTYRVVPSNQDGPIWFLGGYMSGGAEPPIASIGSVDAWGPHYVIVTTDRFGVFEGSFLGGSTPFFGEGKGARLEIFACVGRPCVYTQGTTTAGSDT